MSPELLLCARKYDKCLQHGILFNLHRLLLGRYFYSRCYTGNENMLGEIRFVVKLELQS